MEMIRKLQEWKKAKQKNLRKAKIDIEAFEDALRSFIDVFSYEFEHWRAFIQKIVDLRLCKLPRTAPTHIEIDSTPQFFAAPNTGTYTVYATTAATNGNNMVYTTA
jgi:hypothetical protein